MDAGRTNHGRTTDKDTIRTYHRLNTDLRRTRRRHFTRLAWTRALPWTDAPRTTHGHITDELQADYGLHTDLRRTSDGRTTGGHRSDLDESSHPKMGGGGGLTYGLLSDG